MDTLGENRREQTMNHNDLEVKLVLASHIYTEKERRKEREREAKTE